MSEQKTTQQPEQELSEQRRVRREKLAALQAAGVVEIEAGSKKERTDDPGYYGQYRNGGR